MISVNDIKIGMTIEVDGELWRILDFQHHKPGKGNTIVRTKLKNLRTGAVNEKRFNAGVKVAKAMIDTKKMQYLYESGGNYVFMDLENYEQIEIPGEQIEYELKFMLENMEVNVIMFGAEILGVDLPNTVILEVAETSPNIKGDTSSGGSKPATMETGVVVNVPFFVNVGDKLIVNTTDSSYVSRA